MDFKINKSGMAQLQRDLEVQFSEDVEVPLGGAVEDAIQSVTDKLIGMGATPNDAAVEQLVRDARKT